MDTNLDKISLIARRDFERKQDIERRKEDKSNLAASNEKLQYFEETFMQKRAQIEVMLNKSEDIAKNELAQHFNDVSNEILLLQKYVAQSNLFLRTYDIKKCQEHIQELTSLAKDFEDKLLPKKKFGFKKKPAPVRKVEKVEAKSFDQPDATTNVRIDKTLCGFVNRTDEHLEFAAESILKQDVTAENLDNCTVKFNGSPSTLHLNNLKNCQIFSGPVSTSIFAENCQNCTLTIACQQLRLHKSKNVKIYLHVTSRAIMEDCSEIFLAPYNYTYPEIEKDFETSGLDRNMNNWKCVDDFNWLNLEKQSPNWSVLNE